MGKRSAEEKAKREERRKARAQADREAAQALLLDRRGNRRPTPERAAKGSFSLHLTDDAGIRCAVDAASNQLDRLRVANIITADQCQGGHDFAALMERTRLISAGRSCLDFSPVGYEGDDDGDPKAEQDRAELYLACGMATWAEMRRVCCDDRKPSDIARLKAGLDLCVKFWA